MEEVDKEKVEDHYWEKDGLYEEYALSLSPDEDDGGSSSSSSDSDDSDMD